MAIVLPEKKSVPKTALADLTILLHGIPKIGKSTFASHAENTLFLDTDQGLNALTTFNVPIATWEDFSEACHEIATKKHNFRTIAIDVCGNLYKMCDTYICKKLGVNHVGDVGDDKRGYTILNNEFRRALIKLASLPYGLLLICHTKPTAVTTRTEKYEKMEPDIGGAGKAIAMGMSDIMLYATIDEEVAEDGATRQIRVLHTKPNKYYAAGDRFKILPPTLPLTGMPADWHNIAELLSAYKTKET